MKFNTVALVALLSLTTVESFSLFNKAKSMFKRGPSKDKCLRANNQSYGWAQVSSGNYPPCWIENGGKYDCYDYVDKNAKKCNNWGGMFDRTK